MYQINLLAALALACCLNSTLHAAPTDREQPLNVQAASCNHNQKTSVTICTGNVVVTQGSMVISAENLEMRTDAAGNQFARGTGTPVKFRQKLEKSADLLTAESLRFEYDSKKGLLQLFDKAWVRRNQDLLEGDHITYDLNAEETRIKNNPGGRVNIIFTPKKAESQDGKPAQ